jgi:hypothetical protein
MAYQSKNHRKFLATSLTAAMVASAVAPAVSAASFPDVKDDNFYAPYVNQLVDAGIIEGMPNGTFGLRAKVTRAEAAKMVSLIRNLDTKNAPAANFEDVKQGVWYSEYINALYQEKLVDGISDEEFAPNGTLTRAQFAKLVVDAYDLDLKPQTTTPFTDVKENVWYTDYVKTLYANGLINGKTATTFEPNSTIDRADFAKLLVDADLKYGFTLGKAEVTSVNAINSTSVVVSGKGLSKLTAADVKVENNSVEAVAASADGKTATITLKDELVPDQKTKVTVLGTDYEVAYSIDATKIAVKEGQFDDDTSNQFVKVLVDGQEFTAAELIANGYTVEFTAFASKAGGDITSTLFTDDSTGKFSNELDENLADAYTSAYNAATNSDAADYEVIPTAGLKVYVQVKATKDTEVITSDLAAITVKNLDIAGDSISAVELTRTNGDNQFVVTSNKFVTGETFEVSELTVKTSNEEEDVDGSLASVTSSNAAVLSVKNGVVEAEGPGTATLTIAYGGVTTTKTITVTNEERVVKSVAVYNGSSKVTSFTHLLSGADKEFTVRAYDQFGDRIIDDLEASSSNKSVATVETATVDGVTTLTVDPETAVGSTIISFESEISNKLTGTLKFTTTENATVSKYRLLSSDDDKLDVKDPSDDDVTLTLQGLTSEGIVVSSYDLADTFGESNKYAVTINQSSAGVIADADGTALTTTDGSTLVNEDGELALTALKPGTVTVTVKDLETGKTLVSNYKLTVVSEGYSLVSGSSFRNYEIPAYATTIDYTDIFNVTVGSNDPVVRGLKLSKATSYPVRLNTEDASFYIDKNADGVYDDGSDVQVGEVQVTSEGTFAEGTFAIEDFLDPSEGLSVAASDEGTVIFKLVDPTGKVVETKSLKK